MSISDQLFFNVYKCYNKHSKKRARFLAVIYISLFQITFLLLIGIFIATFLNQMNTYFMSSEKAWTLFIITIPIVYFKNWIQYSGRKGKIINANLSKTKNLSLNIWMLWLLPLGLILLSIILLKAF